MTDTAATEDRKVIQCNYEVGTNVAAPGARAYVLWLNNGNGNDRISITVRSRGGRWVSKYEDIRRLTDFRAKTIPPEHPMYKRLDYARSADDEAIAELRRAKEEFGSCPTS